MQALPHPSHAPVLSFAHYFQAPSTQAIQEKKKNTQKNLKEGWCPPSPPPISFLVRPRVKLTLINLGGAQCLVAINIAINTHYTASNESSFGISLNTTDPPVLLSCKEDVNYCEKSTKQTNKQEKKKTNERKKTKKKTAKKRQLCFRPELNWRPSTC